MKTISLRRGVLLLVVFAALLMTATTSSAQGRKIGSGRKAIASAAKSSMDTPPPLPNSLQLQTNALTKIDSKVFDNKPMLNIPPELSSTPCIIDVLSNDAITNARHHIIKKEYDKAKEILTPLAEGGDVNAQFYLGVIYIQPDCKYKDINVAMSWFRRAAEQGDERAKQIVTKIETKQH